jgi:CheY-specific phosphatase CheX
MKPNEQILTQVVEDTFASMAFMFPGGECDDSPVETATVTVAFAGPERGWLEMTLPKGMLDALAANMLGLEESEVATPEQRSDAVREILNVICGNLLPLIDDPRAVYSVSPPVVESAAPCHGQAPSATARVALENGTVGLLLFQQCDSTAPVAG